MERRERRHHTREFKLEAVRLAGIGDKTKAKVARCQGRLKSDPLSVGIVGVNLTHPGT